MKLLFLIGFEDKNKIGGGQYSIFMFARELSKNNEVIVAYDNSIINDKYNIDSMPLLYFSGKGKVKSFANTLVEKFSDYFKLRPLIKKNNFDFIIGSQRKTAIKAQQLGGIFNVPVVNFVFETPVWLEEKWPEWGDLYRNRIRLKKAWKKYKISLEKSDIVISNSKITKNEVNKWANTSIDCIAYPGVSQDAYRSVKTKKSNQIIYVGRLEANKNIHEIIEAISLIDTKVRLVVCGTGSQNDSLKRLANKKGVSVSFKGNVTDEQKWIELKKSLFMVFPSSFEGFGMPPMEAMAVGIPCICSDIPIFKEVYQDNVEYFPEHDVLELSKKIEYFLKNKKILSNNKEILIEFSKKFSWNESAKKITKVLNRNHVN